MQLRKPKKKQLTVQPPRPKLPPVTRQTSNPPAIHEYEPPKDPKKFLETPSLKRDNPKLKKQITILDEMGFGSLLESKAELNTEENKILKRRFSIGITDFWTGQTREKFLREKGYLDVYKRIQEETMKTELKHTSSIRKPELPYKMDSHAKRRASLCFEVKASPRINRNSDLEYCYTVTRSRKCESISELVDPIDSLVGKCEELSKDTKELKKSTERLKVQMRQDFKKQSKKMKISTNDKNRINSILGSMGS